MFPKKTIEDVLRQNSSEISPYLVVPSAIGQEQKLGEGPPAALNYANLLLVEGHTGLCPIFVALHEGYLGNNIRGISTAPVSESPGAVVAV